MLVLTYKIKKQIAINSQQKHKVILVFGERYIYVRKRYKFKKKSTLFER
jgi:hypothetical protein